MTALITRPIELGSPLAATLAQHNIESVCFPVMTILPPTHQHPPQHISSLAAQAEVAIFISPMAVDYFFKHYPSHLLQNVSVLAIGQGTAQRLKTHQIKVTAYPQAANSSALLKLPALTAPALQYVIIFAGENGNTLLHNQLQKRGVKVTMCYTHRRVIANHTHINWDPNQITLSVCTSQQGLSYFRKLISSLQLQALLQKPLIVITSDMTQWAQDQGFSAEIIQAGGARNDQLVTAIKAFIPK